MTIPTILPINRLPVGAQTYSKQAARFDGLERYADHAEGAFVWDTSGRRYVDYVAGLGPVLLGHGYPAVLEAVTKQLCRGVCFSMPTKMEGQLADLLASMVPCAEASRFAKNGADVNAAAVRLARAVTGRDTILRCGYHGYPDWCIADSRGVPEAVRQLTVAFPFNDIPALTTLMNQYQPAAVILEAVPTAITAYPEPGYLEAVREMTTKAGVILIFDEIVTGFRIHKGGAQAFFDVTPDLATFSKGMANGFPIAALCGRADLMKEFENGVFFSTTFGGDPVGLAAAIATLTVVRDLDVPAEIARKGTTLRALWSGLAATYDVGATLQGYDQRLVEVWDQPVLQQVFRRVLLACGLFTQGYYNLMLAHNEESLEITTAAWDIAFRATQAVQSGAGDLAKLAAVA